jgi:sugar phosphate isomerase/epimerase
MKRKLSRRGFLETASGTLAALGGALQSGCLAMRNERTVNPAGAQLHASRKEAEQDGVKFSCIPICFWYEIHEAKTMSQEDWMRMVAELGLDGTEIYEPFISSLDAPGMARLADFITDARLQVSMYTIESDFSYPEQREEAIAHVKRAVDAALVFKTNIVRLTSGSWIDGVSREKVMQTIADGLRGCLDYAEEKQVMLALEDHPPVGGTIEEFMGILELVDDERLKVNLDTGNVRSDTIVDLAKRVAHRVVHVHVSELVDNKHGVVIGKGEVDNKGVFSVLKSAGFDGWLSLEQAVGGKEDLQFSIEYVRKAWNDA